MRGRSAILLRSRADILEVEEEAELNGVATEALRIEEGLKYYEHSHRLTAQAWRRRHIGLGVAGATSAAVSAVVQASALGAEETAIGLAAVAAALGAVLTFLSPEERAEAHRRAERDTNALRLRFRRFRELELGVTVADGREAVRALNDLCEQRDRTLSRMPTYSQKTFETARKQIRSGLFDYDTDADGAAEDG